MLKEAALRTGMLARFSPVGTREAIERDALWERLLLVAYAYGTNTGIGAVAQGDHGHSENDIRYVARRYFSLEGARAVAVELANATFAARQQGIWGESTTTVASDSTHFRSYDQNLFTEWHSRYGGRGVLIYWHVEKKSMVVHSQLLSCSASEVAAMVEGAVRHGTPMQLEATTSTPTGSPRSASPSRRCSASTCCPASSGSTRSSSTAQSEPTTRPSQVSSRP